MEPADVLPVADAKGFEVDPCLREFLRPRLQGGIEFGEGRLKIIESGIDSFRANQGHHFDDNDTRLRRDGEEKA